MLTVMVKIPPELDKIIKIGSNKCCRLNKAVYGLVQAACIVYKKILTYMTENRDFEHSLVEPCLTKMGNGDNMLIVGIYVDNLLVTGPKKLVDIEATKIANHFGVRVKKNVDEYVDCKIIYEGNDVILHQTCLVEKCATSLKTK